MWLQHQKTKQTFFLKNSVLNLIYKNIYFQSKVIFFLHLVLGDELKVAMDAERKLWTLYYRFFFFFTLESFQFRKRKGNENTNICTATYIFKSFFHIYFLILQLFYDIQVVVMFCYFYQVFTVKEKISSRKFRN